MDFHLFYDYQHHPTVRRLVEVGDIGSSVEFFMGPYAGVATWHDVTTGTAPKVADPVCLPVLGCIPIGGSGPDTPSKFYPPEESWLAWLHVTPEPGNIRPYFGSLSLTDNIIGISQVITPSPGVLIEAYHEDFDALQDLVLDLTDQAGIGSVTVSLSTGAYKRGGGAPAP